MEQTSKKFNLTSWFKDSLLMQIIVPFIILIFLVGGIISFVSYQSSVNLTTDELTNNVEGQMVNMSDSFDIYFSNIASVLNRFADNELLTDPSSHKQEVLSTFGETVDQTPAITNLYTGLSSGEIILYPEADLGDDFVVSETDWYQDATAKGDEIIWTQPFVDASTGDVVVAAAKAHYDGDELVGVIAADIKVSALTDMINDIEIGKTGYAVIFDETGRLVAHPDVDMIGADQSEEWFYEEMMSGEVSGIVEYEVDGQETVMGYAKNSLTDWTVGGIVHKADFSEKARGVIGPIFITLAIVSVVVIVVSLLITRRITGSIQQVVERMQQIAAGDLSHESLGVESADEIGQLVHATNEMNEHMRTLLEQIHNVSGTVNRQSEELTLASDEVMASSEQVSATMQELASGAETQADHTTDLSSMMSVFAKSVEEANENGRFIYQSSGEILHMTSDGQELMEHSTDQMNKINEIVHAAVEDVKQLDYESQKISELVAIIEDIAEQTNLLALNAAIEAARAGEHGQGFAVVAEEVRKLAEGVGESVTDITEIVDGIQLQSADVVQSLENGYREVGQGANQIVETGETFQEISTSVEEMVQNIQVVTNNLAEVSDKSHEMNKSVQGIAAVTEEATAGVEETSASSQETSSAMEQVSASTNQLADLSRELDSLIRRFKL